MKEIKLSQGLFAQVDDEDYDYLNQWKWHAHKKCNTFYAERNITVNKGQKMIKMHRVILGEKCINKLVDHKDRNGLNNQRLNLRSCTDSENMMNRSIQKNSTTGIPGITYLKKSKKYVAQIWVDRRHIYLGIYEDIEDARQVRIEATKKYHKEFGVIY